jgi:hypothetical protein
MLLFRRYWHLADFAYLDIKSADEGCAMSPKPSESQQPSLDYRADGNWRVSPAELQTEFRAYLEKAGYRPVQLSPERLKAIFESFMNERNYMKTNETEHILRRP